MKKILCGIMAILMTAVIVSCENDSDSSSTSGEQLVSNMDKDVNLSEEDMPYGATAFELSKDNDSHVKYTICFDKRYFGGDDENSPDYSEVYAVHDYLAALNSNDHDAIKSLYYGGYLDEACKSNGYENIDEYLDGVYNAIVSYLGEGFEINYIDISECLSADAQGAQPYIETVDEYLTNINALDKVTSKKVVEIGGYTCYTGGDGGSYQLTNHMESIIFGLYTIDGQVSIA